LQSPAEDSKRDSKYMKPHVWKEKSKVDDGIKKREQVACEVRGTSGILQEVWKYFRVSHVDGLSESWALG